MRNGAPRRHWVDSQRYFICVSPRAVLSFLSCLPIPNHSVFNPIDTTMKQLATTSLLGLLALLQPTIAAPRHIVGSHHKEHEICISNGNLYHSGNSYLMFGNSYFVHCGKDSTGQVLQTLTVPGGGFSDCSQTCEIMDECGGFSFIGGVESGACYFKTGLGDLTNAFGDAVSCSLDPDGNGVQPEPVPPPEPTIPYYSTGGGSSTSLSAPDSTPSSYASIPSSYASVPSSYASVVSSYASENTGFPSSPPAVSSPSLSLSAYTSPLPSPTGAAAPTPSALDQCQQTVKNSGAIYRGGNGSPYELECGEDHYGGDLTAVGSNTFLGCIDVCNVNPECIGYSYLGGVCYLKKYLKSPNTNPAVNFALNLDRNATAKSPPSSTSTSTAPTATAAAAPGSCKYIAVNGTDTYTDSNNVQYMIQCHTDHNGGDIGNVGAKDFVGCMDACDKTDKCIAFSWVGGNGPGTCYLKGTVTDSGYDVDVDYAYKKTPTTLAASSSASASSYGSQWTSAVVSSSPAPSTTSVSPSSTKLSATVVSPSTYASVPTAYTDVSSDEGGVLTVTVTSYTGSATSYADSATPSTSSKKRIIHPQPNTRFPWPLWPHPTKLPPTKSQHHPHPLTIPEPVSPPGYTQTAWVTRASPTPVAPYGPPPNPPDWQPFIPFGRPPFDLPDGPPPNQLNGPPSGPFGRPLRIPYGVPPFDQPNGPPPNPPNGPIYKDPYDFRDNDRLAKGPVLPHVRRDIPGKPTKTYTKEPLAPTSVGDSAYCDELRSHKPKKLRVEVLEGDYKFIGMWLQDPTRGQ
jgi:hypothetical protein